MSLEESCNRVETNGIWIEYEEFGSATHSVILLIMGLGQQMIGWPDEFVDLLVRSHFRVIRFDNRDTGRSTWMDDKSAASPAAFLEARRTGVALPVPYTLTDMADDALGLMDALGIPAAHVVGVSMGGMIGQILAAKAPERVRTLISIMSSSGDPNLPGPAPEVQARLFVGPPKDATPEQRLEYAAETLRMIAYPDPERAPDAQRNLVERAAKRGVNRAGYARQLLAMVEDGSRVQRLSTIKSPTLVIHGAADPLIPVACGVHTAAHIPGARLEIIEAMGHDLPPLQMRRITRLIAEFIEPHERQTMLRGRSMSLPLAVENGENQQESPVRVGEPIVLGFEDGHRADVVAIRNPYNGAPIADVCCASSADAEQACTLAQQAFAETRRLSSWQRAAILNRVADALIDQTAHLSELIVLEAGKPITDARNEVARAIQTFRVAAEEAKRIGGDVTPADWTPGTEGRVALSRRFPIGPILGITPFNFPVNLVAHKLAPAIASGCPIIIKPAPQTPLCALWLGRAVREAGWPAAAISVLPCSNEVTAQLVADSRIAMLSFTGSATVGWMLRHQAATPRVTLELGGNAALIVCEDADPAKVVPKIVAGGFTYAGQSCISVQRVFVHASLKARLIEGLVAGIRTLTMGDPADASTRIGPMINEAAAIRAESWIAEAIKLGATLHTGGKRSGTMLEPALLSDVASKAQLSCEEVFAPVVIVEAYEDFAEVLATVNRSKYGLQAAIFTGQWKKMTQAWNELEVGAVLVDESTAWRADHLPYGGVKNSGVGREGVRSAIHEMTEARLLILPAE